MKTYSNVQDAVNAMKSIIDSLQSTSGRNDKIAILKANKDNADWTELLQFLFDPMVVTGISTKKISKVTSNSSNCLDPWTVMDYLRTHHTGTLEDVQIVVNCINGFGEEHVEWLTQLFIKTLKLGVDATSINTVYGKGFIKIFSVMLAESFANYPEQINGKEFIVTQKLDGCRCVAFVHSNGEVQFFTRNGQDYGEVPGVAADLLKIGAYDVAYDGELIAESNSDDTNEVFRKTISTANSKGVKTGLVYNVFDMLPIDEFMNGNSPFDCKHRKFALHTNLESIEDLKWVKEVPILYQGTDQSKISELSAMAESKGWEGLMINVADAPYQAKRVRDLLKVKKFKTVDVRVTGVFEGEGALAGTLGGVDVEFDVDGTTYTAKCGSGFNLDQREKYWKDPNLLIGKIVELKVFEVSKDVDGNYSLRFPIWLDIIRFDKDSTSIV